MVLVGQRKALGIAVRNDRTQRRYSGLHGSGGKRRGSGGTLILTTAIGQACDAEQSPDNSHRDSPLPAFTANWSQAGLQ